MLAPAPEDEPITAINVTPLVDVTLVLVIIFMITMPFLVERAMRVSSSQQQVVAVSSIREPILIELSQRGIHIENQSVSLDQLVQDLRERMEKRGVRNVAVSADASIQHGEVVKVLDHVMEAGASHLDLIEPRGNP